ncbi:cysteine sulfinic acid decarboxylase-like isoform X2 [Tubulanus polymorphus]|uniref:cysteine sulfinic acid decarboxylase-like isoform X2 n=1 Tax=Tubulanus polymorphus TaxID=672921 RepID=UPI003DA4E365
MKTRKAGILWSRKAILINMYSKVTEYLDPEEVRKIIDFKVTDAGCDEEQLYSIVSKIVKHSVKTGHRLFFNQLFQGLDINGLSGALLTEAMNTSMATYELSPVFTLMENYVLDEIIKLIGYDSGEGTFCPGGSLGNMYGLNLARYRRYPEIKRHGSNGLPHLCIFTSVSSHYSIGKGASFLGIGSDHVIKIPIDENGRMIVSELEIAIEKVIKSGKVPLAIVATAGTTVYGAIDPLDEIGDIANRYEIWMHVDGAVANSLLFSGRYRHLIAGIQKADSIIWNPHKLLGIPLQCSAFLTKHKGLLIETHESKASYLFQQDKFYDVSYDNVGDRVIQCGRKIDSFKFWLAWKAGGNNAFEKRIDKAIDNSRYMAQEVRRRPEFELVLEPQTITVCFWYIPRRLRGKNRDEKWWAEMHKVPPKVKEAMMKDGSMMVGYQPCDASKRRNFFRFVIHNPALTHNDIDNSLDIIDELGRDI